MKHLKINVKLEEWVERLKRGEYGLQSGNNNFIYRISPEDIFERKRIKSIFKKKDFLTFKKSVSFNTGDEFLSSRKKSNHTYWIVHKDYPNMKYLNTDIDDIISTI